MRWLMTLAALCGAAGVLVGAFGAHGLDTPQARDWAATAGQYLTGHAVAVLAAGALLRERAGPGPVLMLAGAGVFAAALCGLALGLPRWLGAVAPIGGTGMVAGWLLMARTLWVEMRG